MQKLSQFLLLTISLITSLITLFIFTVPNINCTSMTSSDTTTVAIHDTIIARDTITLDTICPFHPDTITVKGNLIDCNSPNWFQTLSDTLITKCTPKYSPPNLPPVLQAQIDSGRILWDLDGEDIGFLQFEWGGVGYSGEHELDSSKSLEFKTSIGEIEIKVNKINAIFTANCGNNDSAIVYTDSKIFRGRLDYSLYFINDIEKIQISPLRGNKPICLRKIIKK